MMNDDDDDDDDDADEWSMMKYERWLMNDE